MAAHSSAPLVMFSVYQSGTRPASPARTTDLASSVGWPVTVGHSSESNADAATSARGRWYPSQEVGITRCCMVSASNSTPAPKPRRV